MRKVKLFDDYFEIYDDDVLVDRLPKVTDQYFTLELHLDSLQPKPDKVVPGAVPFEVSMRQARLALLQFGMLNTVNTIIANMPPGIQGDAARIEWEYATGVKRNSQLVTVLAPMLGLTDDQMDQLFFLAATFE